MKKAVKNIFSSVKPLLERLVRCEAALAVLWARAAFTRLKVVQWSLAPQPEHFDYRIDLYSQWLQSRNPLWLERGVFSGLAIKSNGHLLELACGNGFSARNFLAFIVLRWWHVISTRWRSQLRDPAIVLMM